MEENRELRLMKLLMTGLKFKLGFVPVFHFPAHRGGFQSSPFSSF